MKIKQREAYEKAWLLRISVQPNCDVKGQREGFAAAAEIGNIGRKNVRKSAFDVVDHDRDARVRMIGSAWLSGGEEWARGHRRQVEWLKSQGITLEEAGQEFNAWWAERTGEAAEEIGASEGITNAAATNAATGPEDRPGEGISENEPLSEPLVDSSF